MCVASGECSTSMGSNPKDSTPSKIRSPDPSRTGAMSSVSSSTTPAPTPGPPAGAPPEHVGAHEVRAAGAHEPAGRRLVGLVGALVAEVPAVQLDSAL